jgi:hypothetical protein
MAKKTARARSAKAKPAAAPAPEDLELPKQVTMSEFRKEVGEYVRAVAKEGRSFVLLKSGKALALLVPIEWGQR